MGDSIRFELPLLEMVINALVVFGVLYGIMKLTTRKVPAGNIIETIKNENIQDAEGIID